jgi:hypothetical protein
MWMDFSLASTLRKAANTREGRGCHRRLGRRPIRSSTQHRSCAGKADKRAADTQRRVVLLELLVPEAKRGSGVIASLEDVMRCQRAQNGRRLWYVRNLPALYKLSRDFHRDRACLRFGQRDGTSPRHFGRERLKVRNQSRSGRPVCEVGAYRLGTDSLKEGFVFESLRLRRDRHVALVTD